MVIYEVNLEVENEAAPDFEAWLNHHIPEVVQCGNFKEAKWYRRNPSDEGLSDTSKTYWTIHYYAKDRQIVEIYLKEHAPRLREEGLRKFGEKFKASRRILTSTE